MRACRPAFSLVETVVAVAVGLIVLSAAYTALGGLARGAAGTDKRASRAIVTARLLEHLLIDLRSAAEITDSGPGQYQMKCHVARGGALETVDVVWRQEGNGRVIRRSSDGQTQTFGFDGLLDRDVPAIQFRLRRIPDGLFAQ